MSCLTGQAQLSRLRMNSRKKFPLGRNTVNHLAGFKDTAVRVDRVREAPTNGDDSEKQADFSETITGGVLKAAADLFENKKVYGNDTETKIRMKQFMDGLENYLIENKSLLKGNVVHKL